MNAVRVTVQSTEKGAISCVDSRKLCNSAAVSQGDGHDTSVHALLDSVPLINLSVEMSIIKTM